MIRDLVAIAATQRRIRRMKAGKRCSACGQRFAAPGCQRSLDGRSGHIRYSGDQAGQQEERP